MSTIVSVESWLCVATIEEWGIRTYTSVIRRRRRRAIQLSCWMFGSGRGNCPVSRPVVSPSNCRNVYVPSEKLIEAVEGRAEMDN